MIKMTEGDLYASAKPPKKLKIPKRYRLMRHPNEKASTSIPLGGGWIRIGGKDEVLRLSLEDIPYPHQRLDRDDLYSYKEKAELTVNKLLAKLSAEIGEDDADA